MAKKPKLSSQDWIKGAFRALTLNGPQAIKAEAIARDLKVSKGSFYWHFNDIADLKAKMLSHWQQAATQSVIDIVDSKAATPRDQLRMVVSISTGARSDDYGGQAVEAAIRNWARYDANARAVLALVDGQRLAYLAQLFAAHGVPKPLCQPKACLLYAGLIGLEELMHTGKTRLPDDLKLLLELLLK